MLNVGPGELILIGVVALILLGPQRLPELARGLGKFMREFRRQTDDVRGLVQREFYRMDEELRERPPVEQDPHAMLPNGATPGFHDPTLPPAETPPTADAPPDAPAASTAPEDKPAEPAFPTLRPPDGTVARGASRPAPVSAEPSPVSPPAPKPGEG